MKVLHICSQHFNGNELWTAFSVMKRRGHTVCLTSTGKIIVDEVTGERRRLKRSLDEPQDPHKFDALIFTSGNMQDSEAYWTNKTATGYVKEFNAQGKPIAAICITVPVLAPAVDGKTVTCFPLIRSKEIMRRAGATLSPVSMVRDQNIVTAENQMMTQMWAEEFCNLLEGIPPQFVLTDSGFVPGGIPRKPIRELELIKAARARQANT
jgi:protease I